MNSAYEEVTRHRIHPEVVRGSDGHLFLSGGNHDVEAYLFGTRPILQASFENFSSNLAERARFCAGANARYVHVVCPDKQTVYKEHYPSADFVALGDRYRDKTKAEFIYPVEVLREAAKGRLVYRTADSHWNEDGVMAAFLPVMVDGFQFDYQEMRHLVQRRADNRVIRQVTTGDLSAKLPQPQVEDVAFYTSADTHLVLSNKFRHNVGTLRMTVNPVSHLPKSKLVVFGDSFLEGMIPLFAQVFECVLFVRSAYFHPEIVAMMRPEYVLSGNAERYLSFVDTDYNAGAALLTAFLRGHSFDHGNPFYKVLDAYSRRSESSRSSAFKAACESFFAEGAYRKAFTLLKQWMERYPATADLAVQCSRAAFKAGDIDEAKRYSDLSLELAPEFAAALGHAGAMCAAMGEFQRSADLFKKCTELDPRGWVGYRGLASALGRLGQKNEAVSVLNSASAKIGRHPEFDKLLAHLAGA